MKALIAFTPGEQILELATAIEKGAKTAEMQTTTAILGSKDFEEKSVQVDVVFIGFQKNGEALATNILSAKEKPIALFCVQGNDNDPRKISELLQKSQAKIVDSLCITPKSRGFFSKGKIMEDDLERARAFGERISNRAQSRIVRQKSEKERIAGYRK